MLKDNKPAKSQLSDMSWTFCIFRYNSTDDSYSHAVASDSFMRATRDVHPCRPLSPLMQLQQGLKNKSLHTAHLEFTLHIL